MTSSTWDGMKLLFIGSGSAWYYHQDRTLVLWELLLEDEFRQENPTQDAALTTLWQGIERFLLSRFPSAQQLVTTADDPLYDAEPWPHHPGSPAVAVKHRNRNTAILPA